ncbi:hypothetical protein DFP73DRAFT_587347 [Morchella snyderi]|nr:hypothetical protein DFP73DRAFT_587347 [Morchella snyderi]
MHYSSVTFILPMTLSLLGSVAAFAFPSPQDYSGCTKCMDLVSSATACNWDMSSGTAMTATQVMCMCGSDSFKEQYADCMSCTVNAGYMDASTAASYSAAIMDGCSQLTGTGTSTSDSSSGSSTGTSSGSSSSSTSSSSGGSTSTGTGTGTGTSSGTSSGNSNSNDNSVLGQSGAGALSAGSGQFVLGAVAAVGIAFYAL